MCNDLPDDLESHLIDTTRYLLGQRMHENDDRMLSYIKRNAKRYLLWNGKLFRRTYRGLRVILPQQERVAVLQSFLDEMGHWDLETTKQFIASRCWWPTMGRDIFDYIRSCTGFQHASPLPRYRTNMSLPNTNLFDIFSIDCSTSGFLEVTSKHQPTTTVPSKFGITWGCLKRESWWIVVKQKRGMTVLGNQGPTAQEHAEECEVRRYTRLDVANMAATRTTTRRVREDQV